MNKRRLYVKVIPRASRNKVEKISEKEYKVWLVAAPEKGKANSLLIQLLADYFSVAKSQINIVAGKTTRLKIVDVFIV